MLRINDITLDFHSIMKHSKEDPFVTDSSRPMISYQLASDGRDIALRSACIRMNSWKKETDRQIGIEYGGEALKPFTDYEVHIRVTDDKGNTAEARAGFRTGKLKEGWRAVWITDSSVTTEMGCSPVPIEFRRIFEVKKKLSSAYMVATAMGIYDLYLDGERVHQDYFSPGFTDYDHYLQYGYYSLKLEEGKHELRAVVASGWACGRTTHISDTTKSISMLSAKRPAFLGELYLEYEDQSTEMLPTDTEFEVARSHSYVFADFYDGEIFDAQGGEPVWKKADKAAVGVRPKLIARYGERIRAHESMMPKSYIRNDKGKIIYDFGQNFAGVIKLKVRSEAGRVIIIRHGEALEHDSLYVQNLRSAKQRVTYTCREGWQEYSPRFTYMGFRYAEIEGIDEDMIKRGDFLISAHAVYSDLKPVGTFSCSNPDLNQLQSNVQWSGRSNFVDIPTDCPQRDERQGWTGDIALFAETACFNFSMDRFLMKWLRDMKAEQGSLGAIPFVVPVRKGVTPSITTSCWGDSCIIVPYALYKSSGNISILREMYPVMKRYLADVRRWAALSILKYGSINIFALPFQFGDWCAPYGSIRDWLGKGAWTGTAYYGYACRLMSEIAACLGRDRDAGYYRKKAEAIGKTYMKKFMDKNGAMPKEKEFQTGYVLPIHFGFGDRKLQHKMAQRLWELIRENGTHISTGFTATPFVLFALADAGLTEEAYELLLQDTNPSWLYQIRRGATTIWEQWDIIREDTIKEGSMNHYAYGAVADFFYKRICGLECIEPGYAEFRVKPVIGGGLTFARCTHESPYGLIEAAWEQDEADKHRYHLKVTVPVGTHCEVVVDQKTERVGSGKYEFSWKKQ